MVDTAAPVPVPPDPIDPRLLELRVALARLEPRVEQSIERMDKILADRDKKSTSRGAKAWAAVLEFLKIVVIPIAVVYVGIIAKDRISQAIAQQEADISAGSELQELLKTLYADSTTPDDATSVAFAVAAFGPVAVIPLLAANTMESGRRALVENAVIAVAATNHDRVCEILKSAADPAHVVLPAGAGAAVNDLYADLQRTQALAVEIRGILACRS